MSFKGIVTRKDKETGVDLLAKIVTENKKKSAKKTYKVRVASNGLSDTECCSRAVTIKKEEVSKAGPGGADDLTVSINLNALGAHGTTLTYKIVNDNAECPLTEYLSINGTLLGCPVFGSGDATGRLYITASKGEASITAVVSVTVKAYTAEAILYDSALVSKELFWKAMTSTNPQYMLANDKINFMATWEPWGITGPRPSNQPITVTYSVTDKLNPYGLTRIADNAAGQKEVQRPPYSKLLELQDVSTNFKVENYQDPNMAGSTSKCLQCNGLIVRATLALGETIIAFEYDISTRSAVLTNEEVISAIEALTDSETPNGNKAYSKFMLTNADASGMGADLGGYFMGNYSAPSERGGAECYNIDVTNLGGSNQFRIQGMTANYFTTHISLPALGLTEGNISITINDPVVHAFNGRDEYCNNPAYTNAVFDIQDPCIVAIDLATMKTVIDNNPALSEDATAFAVSQSIDCDKYGGTPKTLMLMKWFYVTNIDTVTAAS